MWPIYFIINELPLALRHVHMMLSALWIGATKPHIDSLFKPIVNCLEKLHDNGFVWMNDGRSITTKVYMCLFSCVSVARPLIQGPYLYEAIKNQVVVGHRNEHMSKCCSLQTWLSKVGYASLVSKVPAFCRLFLSLIWLKGLSQNVCMLSFLVLYGSLCFYGVTLLLIVNLCHYLGRKLLEIDNLLLKIKPPCAIKRLPRSLSTRKYWKASEWRSFLLFYSPVVLKSCFPREYFRHWYLLVFFYISSNYDTNKFH